MDRRSFLNSTLGLALPLVLRPHWSFAKVENPTPKVAAPVNPSPIAVVSTKETQTAYTGDNPHSAHAILWNLKTIAEQKAWPKPTETQEVVVIGGGLSGFLSAYQLKKYKPVVLDQAAQFGGNSKGEKMGDVTYSIGAAYIGPPEKGDRIDTFLKKLGIHSKFKFKEEDFDFLFTDSPPDAATRLAFDHLRSRLDDVYNNRYPELPNHPDSKGTSSFLEFDQISFETWLKNEKIETDLPFMKNFLRNYTASIYGGFPNELSAAHVLNFFSSDIQSLFIPEGGNSLITNAIFEDLKKNLPQGHLRARSMVVNVDIASDEKDDHPVRVTYFDENNELKTIRARKAVVSTAKFIARKIVACLPEKQKQAMDQLEYRPYLIANVILKKKVRSITYDLFSYSDQYSFADIVFANWVKGDQGDHTVLTLYRPFTKKEARAEILVDTSYKQQKKTFETDIRRVFQKFYPKDNLDKEIFDIRVTRWGHPLPFPRPGMVKNGIAGEAARTIRDRIYFVNQDNMLNASFESCFYSALQCAKAIG